MHKPLAIATDKLRQPPPSSPNAVPASGRIAVPEPPADEPSSPELDDRYDNIACTD
jgi:hypothetical protein